VLSPVYRVIALGPVDFITNHCRIRLSSQDFLSHSALITSSCTQHFRSPSCGSYRFYSIILLRLASLIHIPCIRPVGGSP